MVWGFVFNILTSKMKIDNKADSPVFGYPNFGEILEIQEVWKPLIYTRLLFLQL